MPVIVIAATALSSLGIDLAHVSPVSASTPYEDAVLADSPTVYYQMGDGSCCTASDDSGNGNDGTYASSGVTYGVTGATQDGTSGVTDDGSTVAVSGSDTELPSGNASRSAEIWAKTTYDSSQGVFGYGYGGSGNRYFGIWLTSPTTLQFTNWGTAWNFTLPYAIDDGAWHQFAVTYDGSTDTITMYLDGQDMGSQGVGGDIDTVTGVDDLQVGGLDTISDFDGSLDEFSLYPSVLSASDIRNHWMAGLNVTCPGASGSAYETSVMADDPLEFYPLNETSGSEAMDVASDSGCQPGAYGPGVSHDAGTPDGSAGDVLDSASASGADVSISNNGLPSGASPRSMELWFNTTSTNFQWLASYGPNNGNNQFGLLTNGSGDLQFENLGTAWNFATPYSITDGTWHQVDITYDGGTGDGGTDTVTMYLDGQQIGSQSTGGDLDTQTYAVPLTLGSADEGGADNFTGDLADFSIYSSVLSASDVNGHWRSVTGGGCSDGPASGYNDAVRANDPVRFIPLVGTGTAVTDDYSGSCLDAMLGPGVTVEGDGILDNTGSPGTDLSVTSADLPSGNADRSVELWFKTTSTSFQWLASDGPANGGNHFGLLTDGSTDLQFEDWGTAWNYTTPYSITDGTWHQVVATYASSSNDLVMYLDGQELGSQGVDTLDTSAGQTPFELGSSPNGVADNFEGELSEFSMYDSVLTSDDVAAHYGAMTGIASWNPDVIDLASYRTTGDTNNAARHQPDCSCQDPVNNVSGNLYEPATDINVPGRGFNLNLTRTYNSLDGSTDGPFGYGWSSNLGMSLAESGDDSTVTITDESGAPVTFTWNSSDSTWVAPDFNASTLVQNEDGSWTYTRWDGDAFSFNSSGLLASEADRNGNTSTFTYDSGNLSTMTDASGRTLTFTWSGGHISQVEDPDEQTVSYGYDDAGNLTSVTNQDAGVMYYTYDSSHDLLTVEDPDGNTTTNTYNGSDQVLTQTDPRGHETTWSYGVAGPDESSTLVTDPNGDETSFVFGAGNMLLSETAAYGTDIAATTTYTYDPTTLAVASETDPDSNTTTYTYDDSGNLLTKTDALGHESQYTYNDLNEVLTAEDPNGVTTTNTYDGDGNLLTSSTPLSGTSDTQETQYTYGDGSNPGLPTAIENPDGHTTDLTYDSYGDVATSTDEAGHETSYTYDILGRKLTEVSPEGHVSGHTASDYTTTSTYNPLNEVLTVEDPDGNTTTNTYDADGNLLTTTQPSGSKTVNTYNADNKVTEVQQKNSSGTVVQTTSTGYDDDNNVTSQTDGNGNETTYAYNALNEQTSTTNALDKTTDSTYDGDGNLHTEVSPNGVTTTYSYNDGNELTGTSYSDSTHSVSYSYDDDGRKTGMTDGTGTSSWTYNSLGELTSYTNGADAEVQYGYDLGGNQTSITYPGDHEVTQGFNDANEMTSVTDWNSNESTFSYDADGNLTGEDLANSVTDAYSFDHADNLTGIDDTNGGTTIFSADYGRNSNSLISTDSSESSSTGQYQYTALNQVCYAGSTNSDACGSAPSGADVYSYDNAGNLTNDNGTTQKFNAGDELCWSYSGSSSNACGSAPTGATTYTYNDDGNRTATTPSSGSATAYSYNGADELTQYQLGSGTATTYAYDGDGLRMSKTTGSTTADFTWDATSSVPLLLQEKTGSNTTDYIYGPSGLPLEEILPSSDTYYYAHDALGSTRALTDSGGDVADTDTYDPYGNVTTTGSVANSLLYTGQYLDSESGLYYLRARYYDPTTAQFLAVDPLVAITESPYGYTAGDPINGSDPTGLICATWSAGCDSSFADAFVSSGVGEVTNGFACGLTIGIACQVEAKTPNGANNVTCQFDQSFFWNGVGAGEATTFYGAGSVIGDGTSAASADDNPGSSVVGKSGSPVDIEPGTNSPAEIDGTQYTGHALDQMASRGIPPSVVQNTLRAGVESAGYDGATVYTDPVNGVRVVVNPSGSIKTVTG